MIYLTAHCLVLKLHLRSGNEATHHCALYQESIRSELGIQGGRLFQAFHSLVPRLLPSFLSYSNTVCNQKAGEEPGNEAS